MTPTPSTSPTRTEPTASVVPSNPNQTFEIRISRTWDGRYLAVMPGIHPACSFIANTLQDAARKAQASAFLLMADFIRSNQPLPEAMRDWFYTVVPEGRVSIGGIQFREVSDSQLIHPDNNAIPAKPLSESKPNLPKRGSPEYDKLMSTLPPSSKGTRLKAVPEPPCPRRGTRVPMVGAKPFAPSPVPEPKGPAV